jgi:hypothetical protein
VAYNFGPKGRPRYLSEWGIPLVTLLPSKRLMIMLLYLAKALAIKWSRVDQRASFMWFGADVSHLSVLPRFKL